MGRLYPFLMLPRFDPRPWGTRDLSPIYPNRHFEEKIGESWLTGDDCQIASGPLTGQTLAQVTEKYRRAAALPSAAEVSFPARKAECTGSSR